MQTYEIRILNDDLSTRSTVQQQYMNDGAAIRSARYFAEPRPFEVWRGQSCVLAPGGRHSPTYAPFDRSGP